MKIVKWTTEVRDLTHRFSKPIVKAELYHKEDDEDYLHNDDGPAVVNYFADDVIAEAHYFLNNRKVSKEEWEKRRKK